jgi:hypothetical protein
MSSKQINTSKETRAFLNELQPLSQAALLTRISSILEDARPYYIPKFDKTKNARHRFIGEIISPLSYCILEYCHRELKANIAQPTQGGSISIEISNPNVPTLYSALMVALKPSIADTFICEKLYRSLSGLSHWIKDDPDYYYICLQASAIMRTEKFNSTRKVVIPKSYLSFDDQLDQLQ